MVKVATHRHTWGKSGEGPGSLPPTIVWSNGMRGGGGNCARTAASQHFSS